MAEYDDRIPERLQLLRVGLGGKDELGVFMFSITGDYYPSFCLAPATDDPETMDVPGAIEQTLHDLLDYGGTDKDVRFILGLVPREELDEETLVDGGYTDIDLGWCIDGQRSALLRPRRSRTTRSPTSPRASGASTSSCPVGAMASTTP